MRKGAESFEDSENRGNYFVWGVKGPMEALMVLGIHYPETKDKFKPKDAKEAYLRKCLDCDSYWVSEDVCGECGEYRLSKREKFCYYVKTSKEELLELEKGV